MVRGPPPAQRVSREGERFLCSSMLQLSFGGGRETLSRQVPGLQTREGGASEEEITINT
jgi:hypothetical protein